MENTQLRRAAEGYRDKRQYSQARLSVNERVLCQATRMVCANEGIVHDISEDCRSSTCRTETPAPASRPGCRQGLPSFLVRPEFEGFRHFLIGVIGEICGMMSSSTDYTDYADDNG
jgi:hypothetical protein